MESKAHAVKVLIHAPHIACAKHTTAISIETKPGWMAEAANIKNLSM